MDRRGFLLRLCAGLAALPVVAKAATSGAAAAPIVPELAVAYGAPRWRINPAWENAPYEYSFHGPTYLRKGFAAQAAAINETGSRCSL